jgi:hypothetical protein
MLSRIRLFGETRARRVAAARAGVIRDDGVMTGGLLSAQDLVVAMDYGQFYLHDGHSLEIFDLAQEAIGGVGIAQGRGMVAVTSPHQCNFEMPLRVEVWESEPPDDLDEWQEAFEAHLDVSGGTVLFQTATLDPEPIVVPDGSYHALITGRDFVAPGWWPSSTEPGDRWRIRFWPSDGPVVARRLRRFSLGAGEDPDFGTAEWQRRTTHEADGRAASERIRDDLDRAAGARAFSGQSGALALEHAFPHSRVRVFPLLHEPWTWLTWGWGDNIARTASVGDWFYIQHDFMRQPERVRDDWILGSAGDIRGDWIEVAKPSAVAYRWTWRQPPQPRRPPWDDTRGRDEVNHRIFMDWISNRLAAVPPTTVRIRLTQARIDDSVRTTVELRHEDIPIEWVDDLTSWWTWTLERLGRMLRYMYAAKAAR